MGHLTKIANNIIECTEKGTTAEKVKSLLKGNFLEKNVSVINALL